MCDHVALALASAAGLRWSLLEADDRTAWVVQTHHLIETSKAIALDALQAQNAFRGFLLTQDRSLLEHYSQGSAALDRDLAELAQLLADNPVQLGRIVKVHQLYDQWRARAVDPLVAAPSTEALT